MAFVLNSERPKHQDQRCLAGLPGRQMMVEDIADLQRGSWDYSISQSVFIHTFISCR